MKNQNITFVPCKATTKDQTIVKLLVPFKEYRIHRHGSIFRPINGIDDMLVRSFISWEFEHQNYNK